LIRATLCLILFACCAVAAEPDPQQLPAPPTDDIPTIVITPDNDGRIQHFEARGRDNLIKFRDISAARLWLEYAANRKSMRAARMLSDSYNPVWLIEHHVIGWEGLANPEQAFIWAKTAYELGDKTPGNLYAQAPKK
jgi:TPR repeat protein